MVPSNDLFNLIKSLTKSEKRYFKLLVKISGDRKQNNTIKLFDAIDKQKEYDENLLKQKFKNERFVKQFAFTKNYLQNLIIKSLTIYHQDSTIFNQLYVLLHSTEVLYEKGQLSLCMKNLQRGKKLAEKYQQSIMLDRFIEIESRLLMLQSEYLKIEELVKYQNKNIKEHKKVLTLKGLAFRMHFFSLGFSFSSQDETVGLEEMFERVTKIETSEVAGLRYKYSFYVHYYQIKNDYKKVYEYNKKCLDLIEKNPFFKEIMPVVYITELSNYCNSLLRFGKIDEAFEISQKLRGFYDSIIEHRKSLEIIPTILLSYNFESFICMLMGESDNIREIEKQAEDYLYKHEDVTPASSFYDICFNFAVNQFVYENFDKVNDWIDRILYKTKMDYTDDVYYFARFISLMTHFELGNFKLLQNLISSTQRFLKLKNLLNETDIALLNFLKASSKTGIIDTDKLLYLKGIIEENKAKLININPLTSLVYTWVRGKVENKPMRLLYLDDFKSEVQLVKASNS